jgi:hypothetical protein
MGGCYLEVHVLIVTPGGVSLFPLGLVELYEVLDLYNCTSKDQIRITKS